MWIYSILVGCVVGLTVGGQDNPRPGQQNVLSNLLRPQHDLKPHDRRTEHPGSIPTNTGSRFKPWYYSLGHETGSLQTSPGGDSLDSEDEDSPHSPRDVQSDGPPCRDDLCYNPGNDVQEIGLNSLGEEEEEEVYYDSIEGMAGGPEGFGGGPMLIGGRGFECPPGYRKVNRAGLDYCEPLPEQTDTPDPRTVVRCEEDQRLVETETGSKCVPAVTNDIKDTQCPQGLVVRVTEDIVECVTPEILSIAQCPPGLEPVTDDTGHVTCVPDISGEPVGLPGYRSGGSDNEHTSETTTQKTKTDQMVTDNIPECSGDKVPAMSAEGYICIEPILPTALCPPDRVPRLEPWGLECLPCPYGHVVEDIGDGLMCVAITTETSVTPSGTPPATTEKGCPAGLVPLETGVGMVCQYVPPADPQEAPECPSGHHTEFSASGESKCVLDPAHCPRGHNAEVSFTGEITCVLDLLECPQGEVVIATADGEKHCGVPTSAGTDCPEGQEVITMETGEVTCGHLSSYEVICPTGTVARGDLCLYPDIRASCPPDHTLVTRETGVTSCQLDSRKRSDCMPGMILTASRAGFQCESADLPVDLKPGCETGKVMVRLGQMFECIASIYIDLVCNEGEEMVRQGEDFLCSRTGESTGLDCGPGEIIVPDDGSLKCASIQDASLCEDGFLALPDDHTPKGFVCKRKRLDLKCPMGFNLVLQDGLPLCISDSDSDCLDPVEGSPAGCHGDRGRYPAESLSPCEAGYQVDIHDGPSCALETQEPGLQPDGGMSPWQPCSGVPGCSEHPEQGPYPDTPHLSVEYGKHIPFSSPIRPRTDYGEHVPFKSPIFPNVEYGKHVPFKSPIFPNEEYGKHVPFTSLIHPKEEYGEHVPFKNAMLPNAEYGEHIPYKSPIYPKVEYEEHHKSDKNQINEHNFLDKSNLPMIVKQPCYENGPDCFFLVHQIIDKNKIAKHYSTPNGVPQENYQFMTHDNFRPCSRDEECFQFIPGDKIPPTVFGPDSGMLPLQPCLEGPDCFMLLNGDPQAGYPGGITPDMPNPGNLQPCGTGHDVRPCDLDLDLLLAGCNPDCANGGTCVDGTCVCPAGVTGSACHQDIDECQTLPRDHCQYRCENTFGGYQCTCPQGHLLNPDGTTCTEKACIPDCLNGGQCRVGRCQCPSGFQGDFCQSDRDECATSKGQQCQFRCLNTYGGFQCVCPPGSRLHDDGHTCINTTCIPACRNNGQCENHKCLCPEGFYGIICQFDVNECRKKSPCQQECHNTRGSYWCSCSHGYRLATDGHTCIPV